MYTAYTAHHGCQSIGVHRIRTPPVFGLVVSTYIWTPQNVFSVTEHICPYSLKCAKFGQLNLGEKSFKLLTPAVRFEG